MASVLLLLLPAVSLVEAGGELASSLEVVGESQFNATVLDSDFVTLVELYSGLCGSCKEFAPTWDELSWGPMLAGVHFVRVDIDNEINLEMATDKGVLDDGVPAILLYSDLADGNGVQIMTGDHKLPAKTITSRILGQLKLTRSAQSKSRFVRLFVKRVGRGQEELLWQSQVVVLVLLLVLLARCV